MSVLVIIMVFAGLVLGMFILAVIGNIISMVLDTIAGWIVGRR